MTNFIFVFATLAEAASTLVTLEASAVKEGVYSSRQALVLITGMGETAAASAVTEWGSEGNSIINIGIAAALRDDLIAGESYEVALVCKNLSLPPDLALDCQEVAKKVYSPLFLQEKGLTLITSSYPVHNTVLQQILGKEADLLDMEGYGVAFAAKRLGKPCYMFKIVSDFAKEGGRQKIQTELPQLSLKMAQLVEKIVENKVEITYK